MLSFDNVMILIMTTPEDITTLEVTWMIIMHKDKQIINLVKRSNMHKVDNHIIPHN